MTCTSGIVPRAKIKTIKMTFVFVTSTILFLLTSDVRVNVRKCAYKCASRHASP